MRPSHPILIVALVAGLGLAAACGPSGSSEPDGGDAGTVEDGGGGSDAGNPDGGDGGVVFPPFEAYNNYALIDGEALGEGSTPNADLVKEVPLTLTNPGTRFSLGVARVARYSLTSNGIRAGIVVTNDGTEARCAVRLVGISYRDASGTELTFDDYTFVEGSVGAQGSGFYVQTCLGPGESSWFATIESTTPFDQVAEIVAAEIDEGSTPEGAPTTRVVPQSYVSTTASFPFEGMEVVVLNDGATDCTLRYFGNKAMLLDANGDFLFWVAPDPMGTGDEPLAAQATTTLRDGTIAYDGTSSRVAFRVNFRTDP